MNKPVRTPQQWADEIEKVPAKIRNCVAKLVWWDYFGSQLNHDRWPELDKYLKYDPSDINIPASEIAEWLIKLGYRPDDAERRSRIENLKNV